MTDGFNKAELTELFEFLDDLRASGETNMFGAPRYVQDDLGWERDEARRGTRLWMDTFGDKTVAERVAAALVSA